MTRCRASALMAVASATLALRCDPDVLVGRTLDDGGQFGAAAGSDAATPGTDAGHVGGASTGTAGAANSGGSTPADVGSAGTDENPAGQAGSSDAEAASPVPWAADHESGTTSEWTDGDFGWVFTTSGGSLEVSSEHAESGNLALKSTLAPTRRQDQAVVGRRVRLLEGYYSAWYFVPSEPGALARVIMKLSAWGPDADMFDITMGVRQDGQLGLELYSHAERAWLTEPDAAPAIPWDTWFRVEAFYRSSPDADGRIVVWQDDDRIIDTGAMVTGPDDKVMFIVGSVAAGTLDSAASLYVDNAAIRAGDPPDS